MWCWGIGLSTRMLERENTGIHRGLRKTAPGSSSRPLLISSCLSSALSFQTPNSNKHIWSFNENDWNQSKILSYEGWDSWLCHWKQTDSEEAPSKQTVDGGVEGTQQCNCLRLGFCWDVCTGVSKEPAEDGRSAVFHSSFMGTFVSHSLDVNICLCSP